MVRVVKNATAGTMLAPTLTNEPTNGKAMNAGIKVTLPARADMTVARNTLDLPKRFL